MKTKILSVIIPPLIGFAICVASAPYVARFISSNAEAAEFTGPQALPPNYKQAKTEHSVVAWFDADNREWLRVQGNASATTLTEQWGPKHVTIEVTREPMVAKTLTGWIIVFK